MARAPILRGPLLPWLALALPACDPVIDVEGSFFPAWLLCFAVGIVLAVLGRKLFAALGLEPHLGPLVVVYPSLALLLTLVIWLVFFRV